MTALLIIIIVALMLYYGGKLLHDHYDKKVASWSESIPDFEEPDESAWNWSHNCARFNLRGVNFREVTEGHKEGYIVACLNNPVDKEAIMVMDRQFKHLGYLPNGNGYLYHELLHSHGRYLPVNIMIEKGCDDDGREYFYGYVDLCLDTYQGFDKRKFVSGFSRD